MPDISLNASPYHDPYLYCTQVQTVGSGGAYVSSCQATSFRISDPGQSDDGGLTAAGGTSFAAPSFAGMLSVIEQKMGATLGLGNINPALYSLAANGTTYASAFHDITTGNNQVPCATGSPNCPTSGNMIIGYTAGTGYDQASGLGSVDGNNLATAFATTTFSIGTTTKLTATPANPAAGATVTLTATVAAASGTTVPGGIGDLYSGWGSPAGDDVSRRSGYHPHQLFHRWPAYGASRILGGDRLFRLPKRRDHGERSRLGCGKDHHHADRESDHGRALRLTPTDSLGAIRPTRRARLLAMLPSPSAALNSALRR